MNSLLIEKATSQEDKMRKEGMKRQCNTQIADKEIASLSVKSCVNLLNQTAVDEHCNQQSRLSTMIYPSMIGSSLHNDIMRL